MATQPFRDKVVLITGASSGIGRALAFAFARQGSHLVLVARNADNLRALETELASHPGSRMVVSADVRHPEQVQMAVEAAVTCHQRIDVLVNNAGKGQASTVEGTTIDEFRDILDTNFFGALHFMRAALPQMIQQRSGLLIQISSLNGFFAVPYGSAYCASKFALEALSQSARLELKRHNIHVLIVRPGVTDTQFFNNAKYFRQQNPFPLDHMMSPDRVAEKTLKAAARRRKELVLTAEGKLLWFLLKLSPRLVDWLVSQYVKPRPATEKKATAA